MSILALLLMFTTPASSFAVHTELMMQRDGDENDAGRLELNANILVNDAVDVGSTGDFPIRGRLFLEDLTAQVEVQQLAAKQRLAAVSTLDFGSQDRGSEQFRHVKDRLFSTYTPGILSSPDEAEADSRVIFAVLWITGGALMLVSGGLLGRTWAHRRRVSNDRHHTRVSG